MSVVEPTTEELIDLVENWPVCRIFDLPEDAVVVVAGAYQGKVMQLLADMYPNYGKIVGFEPQTWAHTQAQARLVLGHYKNTPVALYGIGLKTGTFPMGEYHTDACSFVNVNARERSVGFMVEFSEAMKRAEIEHIDLAVVNIEGYEFLLVPHIINNGWIDKIDRLAIQWHLDIGVGDSKEADRLIKKIEENGFKMKQDERWSWTYHVRGET